MFELITFGLILNVLIVASLVTFATERFSPPGKRPRTNGIAVVVSFFIAGGGHIYKGYFGTGTLILFVVSFIKATSDGSWLIIHAIALLHAAYVKPAEYTTQGPDIALCSECGMEFPDTDLTTHDGKLWCPRDYKARLAAG
ncbi:MAG TPA: hypothetical protein VGC13_27085 [Longimicrobium sp.]|jgi:hypothetical protein|uniref:hypothetical protein n=1 Tax=Longimicrobium sp. TaxID=2029185 RepID=UPI002EDB2421